MANTKNKKKQSAKHGRHADRGAVIAELFRLFPTKRYTLKALAAASGGADRDGKAETKRVVDSMLAAGTVESVGSGKYRMRSDLRETMEGVVDMLASGSMYIKVEGQEKDIYVNARNSAHALHGDRVKFIVTHVSRGGTPEGEVTEIVERSRQNYVGVAEVSKNYIFVRPDSRKVPVDIFVHADNAKGVKSGDKVLVHISDWPQGEKSPIGMIVDNFGVAGNNDTEMHAILAEYDLPYRFEPEVLQAADRIPGKITAKDYAERRDMRDVTTFTIDPEDAKDFDDALSIKKLREGVWEIGIHIADVTHYVRPGSVVEVEAEDRATSVYLVDRTVPMLPERLSNELCSLRPNEEKLTFSAVFEIDADANVLQEWFGRTVTYSDRRFTYEEAQKVIETGQGDLSYEITTLNKLARIMRERRFADGAVSFEREEAKFRLDASGKPLGVYFKEQKEANQLIEEFMLLANRKVAEFVGKRGDKGRQRTFVYRVHDKPNPDKLATFKNFILKFGYYFRAEKGKAVSREMNKLMDAVRGKYEENVISTLAVRTMAKAYYSTDNIGHYGLAFPYYTHFTSPIRRYPDMMVHRLLADYLAGAKSPDKEKYEQLCEHSSEMEVRASEAERASIKYKMVEFMLDKLGQEFDGHISGVTEWGIYVELDDTHIEGMVSLRDIDGDYYYFNVEEYAVVGRSTDRRFTLGDGVRIRVLRADLSRRQIDFELVASYDFKTGKPYPLLGGREAVRGSENSTRRKPSGGKQSGNLKGKSTPSDAKSAKNGAGGIQTAATPDKSTSAKPKGGKNKRN